MAIKEEVGRLARRGINRVTFKGSANYWEQRYRKGGTSGDGSYGELAQSKAQILNNFVAEHGVQTVIELGCGDGAQLALAEYPAYVGIDVSRASVEMCRHRFVDDPSKRFMQHPVDDIHALSQVDLTLSLDVIYHLVEDSVFHQHMTDLFGLSRHWVVIFSSNEDSVRRARHVRHRRFSDWIDRYQADWTLIEHISNPHHADVGTESDQGSFADFYIYERP